MRKEIKIASLRSILAFSDNYNTVMDTVALTTLILNNNIDRRLKYDAVDKFIAKVRSYNNIPEYDTLERELKRIARGLKGEYE